MVCLAGLINIRYRKHPITFMSTQDPNQTLFPDGEDSAQDTELRIRELERQIFDLMSLVKAGRALHNIVDPPHLYEVTLAVVAEKLSSGPLSLFRYDKERNMLILEKTRSLGDFTEEAFFEFEVEEGLLWQNILQYEPFPVTSASGKPLFSAFFRRLKLDRLQSDLWVPLFLKDQLIGLLTLGKRPNRQPYDAHDMEFLKQYAATAAASIHSCRLFVERLKEQESLQRTLRNLSMLYDIGRAMTYITDLKELLGFILGQACSVSEAQKGNIMLLNADTERLEVRVMEGLADRKIQDEINSGERQCRTFAPGEGIAGRVFQTGEPEIVGNTSDNESFVSKGGTYADSLMCIPLKVHGDCIGVINVTNKKSGAEFTTDDIDLLEAISDQAAVAINKAQLWEMATTDGLTGVYIRRYLLAKIGEEMLRAARFQHALSIVIMDIDHFKSVNDTYGHDAGDTVLKDVAQRLMNACRTTDMVGRYGGEEFVFLMVETDKESARLGAERLRQEIEEQVQIQAHNVTASFGIASFPEDGTTVEQVMKNADLALYEAKESGRNRVVTFGRRQSAIESVLTPETENPDSGGADA